MCDDLLVVSECGYKTDLVVSYVNSQARFKYLQFGLSKCSKMHVGKTKQNFKCTPVFLDHWTTEEKENEKSSQIHFQEKYQGKLKIKDVSDVKYLAKV